MFHAEGARVGVGLFFSPPPPLARRSCLPQSLLCVFQLRGTEGPPEPQVLEAAVGVALSVAGTLDPGVLWGQAGDPLGQAAAALGHQLTAARQDGDSSHCHQRTQMPRGGSTRLSPQLPTPLHPAPPSRTRGGKEGREGQPFASWVPQSLGRGVLGWGFERRVQG